MRYLGSKNRIAKYLVPIIQSYVDNSNCKGYIEPFCLSGDTILFTKEGIKTLEEIKVGDYIYDENCELKQIVEKYEIIKSGLAIHTKGNIDIKCSTDHPFYDEKTNKEILAKDILGVNLKKGFDKRKEHTKTIDLSNFITISKKRCGRSGKIIEKDYVKLYHNSPIINRYLSIDENLMYVYGWVVAEGDRQYLTLNKNEYDIAKEIIQKYSKIINQDFSKNTIYYFNKNSLSVAVPFPKIYEKIFFQAMKIGYGARNKNICFLFELEPDLVKIALQSMFKGDGSLVKKGKYQSLNYKTSSKTLAYQLQALLSIKFGIKSTLSYGMNKERMIENRVLKPSDYYNISITRFSDIKKIFDNLDSKIKDCVYNDYLVTSVKKISLQKFYDIRLEDNSTHRYLINGGIITHNCGGANIIDKIKCNKKYGFDNHRYLIALLQQAQKDTSIFPEIINEELYKDVKEHYLKKDNKYEDWFTGLVGFCSFGSKWFGGFRRSYNKKGTLKEETAGVIRNLINQAPNLKGITFRCKDFRDLNPEKIKGYVIYNDIPYRNSTKYSTGNYPYEEFYEWCRAMSKNNIVLTSEYWMPDDFECIWQGNLKCTLDKNSRTDKVEKLFKWKG